MSVEEQVKSIVAEQLGVDLKKVTSQASFFEDLGADSLDRVELILAIEEEFDIQIDNKDVKKFIIVNDMLSYIGKFSRIGNT